MEESARGKQGRLRRRPLLRYPGELPITSRRQEIIRAVRSHPVVIVSGETGCGKSTQLPKMCLEAGRGRAGRIGCTQPRRIAAITIAHRIAEELGESLGRTVGYKIRFQDKAPRDASIKIMTDGMLLAETQSDRLLREYDTLLIDEAHERSVNIDFLLGIAKTLLAVRRELKVIITSATLDTEKFSRSFDGAPVIEVSGRQYPVKVEYLPPEVFPGGIDDADYVDMAVRAVDRLKKRRQPGDVLVFMPTEQDILETCEKLEGKNYAGTTILPLYARLPAAQQGRVYSVTGPKIVVATNVAETSLTIPGIRFVVDTGLARIAQYQPGTQINSLPVSPVSRASADQRKGRCGRVQEGLCLRLYSEEDYQSRPDFTPPEILRSNLAEVILRMVDLRLGHPSEFPFVDSPHPKNIKDGYETLMELGAITGKGRDWRLTPLGRRMARMPLDPKISRMLLEAEKEGCLREMAIIASALSIQDPRERPAEKASLADEKHSLFRHPDSDFLTFINLWDRYYGADTELSSQRKRRKFCRDHFLSFTRMREWGFVHGQLLSILREQRISLGRTEKVDLTPALYSAIHTSILSGFLSHIAVHKEKNIYSAAKNREVMVFPGSSLFDKSRPWVVAAELVRTSRLFARSVARIDPAWLEDLGGDLCRYSYFEPHWDKNRGEVRAKERVTLYGLEIISGRDVPYGPVHPEEAHRIFVRSALVEGEVKEKPTFLAHNIELRRRIEEIEAKLRRRNISAGDEAVVRFYTGRLDGVFDLRGLERRIRKMGGDDFLRVSEKDLILAPPDEGELAQYPDDLALGGRSYPLSYRFAPGEEDDGVTLKIPAALISHVPAEPLEWGVPGQFREKILALLKGLPKQTRKKLMPFSETAEIIVKEMAPTGPSLYQNLSGFVKKRFGVEIPPSEWAKTEVPRHLRMRVAVTDHEDREVATGRDIELLRAETKTPFLPEDSPAWKKAREEWERSGLASWDFDFLPESVFIGHFMTAYPGLEPGEEGVNLRLFRTKEEAQSAHEKGVQSLLSQRFAKDIGFMKRYLLIPEEYERASLYFGGRKALEKGIAGNLESEVFRKNLRTREEFGAYAGTVVRALFEKGHTLRETVLDVIGAHDRLRRTFQSIEKAHPSSRAIVALCAELRKELQVLVPKDFVERYRLEKLRQLPRYIRAMELRLERAKNDPEKDKKKASELSPFHSALSRLELGIVGETSPEKKKAVEDFRWMVEELKVSIFAPELKTAIPVSAKRLAAKLKEIEGLK